MNSDGEAVMIATPTILRDAIDEAFCECADQEIVSPGVHGKAAVPLYFYRALLQA
jgi:hypothetical protein